MKPFLPQTVAEQMAAHLRSEIEEGHISGIMPGVLKLETETGANRKTVEAALRILERDGLLETQGAGKGRLIVGNACGGGTPKLRVGFQFFERGDGGADYLLSMENQLCEAGHSVIRAPVTLTEAGMDVRKVARTILGTPADAWVVVSASREVLEWFKAEGIPVTAIFGRRRGLEIASVGPDKSPAIRDMVSILTGNGHRRITWLTRKIRRIPRPGHDEQCFLDELAAKGIAPGAYNMPDWKETREGFQECLETLFRLTPPTAIIADETQFYVAVRHFLAARGISVPGDVSFVCTDSDSHFDWCTPSVSHIHWETRPLVRRVVKWVENVGKHHEDHRATFLKSEFVPGGTIGPARR